MGTMLPWLANAPRGRPGSVHLPARSFPSVRETALLTGLKWQDMGASAVEKGNPNGELSSTLNAARAAGDLDLAVVGDSVPATLPRRT